MEIVDTGNSVRKRGWGRGRVSSWRQRCIQKGRLFLKMEGLIFFFLSFFLGLFSRPAPAAHGGSQARGLIGAIAAGLHHSSQ